MACNRVRVWRWLVVAAIGVAWPNLVAPVAAQDGRDRGNGEERAAAPNGPGTDLVRLAPAGVSLSADSALPDAVRRLEQDRIADAFDRDTTTSYAAYGRSTLHVDLGGKRRVGAVRVFGAAPYRLSVKAGRGATALSGVDLSKFAAGGWTTLALPGPVEADRLTLELEPLASGGAGLAEIEVWGEGRWQNTALRSPQSLVVAARERSAVKGASIGGEKDDAGENAFTFDVPLAAGQVRRAYLAYDLEGLAHWNEAGRSINGQNLAGGHVRRDGATPAPQLEAVAPALIVTGRNTVAFQPNATGSGAYVVRNVRLILEPHDGWNFVAGVTASHGNAGLAGDGDAATGWQPFPANVAEGASMPTLVAEFTRAIAADTLRVAVTGQLSGDAVVETLSGDGWVMAARLNAGALRTGDNDVALKGARGTALRLRFERGEGAGAISEIAVQGSPLGAPDAQPALTISFPDAGQYFGDMGYVRGFLEPRISSDGPARVLVAGKPVVLSQGAFEASVSRSDLNITAEGPWSVDVDAVYPDGRKVTRKVTFATPIDALSRDALSALDAVAFDVVPGAARELKHRGAELAFEADALNGKTRIQMQPLRDVDLPALDVGMINVTRGTMRGFRFLPHGHRFKKAARVRLPFDKAKLPKGMTAKDVKTFYFDTDLGRWQPLATAAVDDGKGELTALTTHFTDMINAVVQAPESPDAASFNPTQLKDIKAANPSAAVNLIEPPAANAMGDARMAYPIELPPGRLGLAPSLSVAYSSAGENGWMGLGWDLAMPSVMVDSRWGVPRYDSANETESYLIDGEQLAPLTHRGALVARTANKSFRARVEGGFRRITRHGNSPGTYWWEVRDKDGTAYFYGGTPESGVAADAILTDAAGNIFKWALLQVRDSNGNAVFYSYRRVADTGLGNGLGGVGGANGAEPGSALYPHTINYTGRAPATAGVYTVTFVRGSQITPADARRPDVQIDGRGGFKHVVADRLRRILVTFNGQNVRSYEFTYREGAFRKSLLEKIRQFDAGNTTFAPGSEFNVHEMTYFDEVRQPGTEMYADFLPRANWTTHEDGLEELGLAASALSGQESDGSNKHLYVGVGPAPTKSLSVGVKVGSGSSDTDGRVALVDIDGDGLQDKVFLQGSTVRYRRNRSGPGPVINTVFDEIRTVGNLNVISRESSSTLNRGPEAYLSAGIVNGFAGLNFSTTDSPA